MNIRHETTSDIPFIRDVTAKAFQDAPHSDQTEQLIIDALRDVDALTLSIVADSDGEVIGHVAVSPVTISDGSHGWFGLGPISVLPDQQGKGVGSQLMEQAIAELKQLGASGCVVLGDPSYYARFGFKMVPGLIFEGAPAEYFMALCFNGETPQGTVTYHAAFYLGAEE